MAQAEFVEKKQRVSSWLKKVFMNKPIPPFEVNVQTIDILCTLKEYVETRDRDVAFLIEDMKQKAAEYKAEADYLDGLLTEGLGISLSSLSSEGIAYVSTLVNSAMTLETKDTSLASFFSAINDMTSKLYATESENRELELELTKIKKKITAAVLLENQLNEDLKKTKERLEVERAKFERESLDMNFLRNKCKDFKSKIKAAEEQLIARGLDPQLTHQSLVSMSEKLAEMQKEVVLLKKKLEYYLDLTPSPSLALVKIEEVKRELNAVEAEFSKQIDMLTLGLQNPAKTSSPEVASMEDLFSKRKFYLR